MELRRKVFAMKKNQLASIKASAKTSDVPKNIFFVRERPKLSHLFNHKVISFISTIGELNSAFLSHI